MPIATHAEAREMADHELSEALDALRDELDALDRRAAGRYSPAKVERRSELVASIATFENELRMRQPLNDPISRPLDGLGSKRRSGSDGQQFRSLGEQIVAIRNAGTPGGAVDPRLHDVRAATGLSEAVPSDGGFLLQPTFSSEIYQAAFETGKLARLCDRMPVTQGNSLKIPGLDETSRAAGLRHGGVLTYWLDEAGEKQASKPKFRLIELQLKKAVVLCYTSDELLQDAAALESYIRKIAGDEIAFSLDDAIVNGTGAGQPLGILNSSALVTVAKENGQSANTILFENILAMWARLLGSSRSRAVWLVNPTAEPELYKMSLAVGVGGSAVYLPAGGVSQAPYSTLFGRPVIPCEQCAALGTVGDLILADLGGGYVLAEKGGVQSDVSIHVRFVYDESVFRFVYRVDGQPYLSAPITPYKGSLTQSHFVALAERS